MEMSFVDSFVFAPFVGSCCGDHCG